METWVADIRRLGGELRGYISYNALVVAMDGAAHARLGELNFLEWSGLLQPYYKISPALQLRLAQGGEARILVEIFSARFLQSTLDALAALPVEVLGAEGDEWCGVIAVSVPVERLKDIAKLPAVEWMELSTSGTQAGFTDAEGLEPGILQGHAATVSGGTQKVALGDSGLGTGGMQGLPPLIRGKVQALNSLRGDDGRDANGHGTAVAGVLLGISAEGGRSVKASHGLIAYATGYGLSSPPQPLSLYSVLRNAYESGAATYLSGSVPEGKESLGAYGIYASQRDAFAWNNPMVSLVEPAGNEGTDADGDGRVDMGSLLGGATAKNVVSVGGTEGSVGQDEASNPLKYQDLEKVFPGRFQSPPLRDDSSADNPSGMAAFSSRGPTRDGRIKPDLVAPAAHVLTVASGGAGSCPGLFPSGNSRYVRAYGTSMAAALVAGNLASMRSLLALRQGSEPSASLLKAFVVNGAADLCPGQYGDQLAEIPAAPNPVEGWGKMNSEFFFKEGSWVKVLDDREGMRLGESRAFKLEVPSGKQLRVTLAWTDYPSLPEARQHLVNDLDLRLVDPEGNVCYPNNRSSRDPLNNVERVVMDVSGKPGDYTVEITAWNVPLAPQPFALVVQVL
jgi:hypothetical protein